jgi:hypothetical protein
MIPLLVTLALFGSLTFLVVHLFHSRIVLPRRIVQSILTVLRDGPKFPAQIAQAISLPLEKLEPYLRILETQSGFIRRERDPALNPDSPEGPTLVHLTESGSQEIEPENETSP